MKSKVVYNVSKQQPKFHSAVRSSIIGACSVTRNADFWDRFPPCLFAFERSALENPIDNIKDIVITDIYNQRMLQRKIVGTNCFPVTASYAYTKDPLYFSNLNELTLLV